MLHYFKVNWKVPYTNKMTEGELFEIELNDGFNWYERDQELINAVRERYEDVEKVDILSAFEVR